MDFNNQERENKYLRAKERVEELKKFYNSLIFFVVFISFLAALNYYTNRWSYMWFLWAAFGWGIAIFFHALKVFRWNPFLGRDWEERKMKEFMDDDENNKWN